MSASTTSGAATALLLRLGIITHGNVLILNSLFRNNVETTDVLQIYNCKIHGWFYADALTIDIVIGDYYEKVSLV